jgi:hypothetical protein
MPGPTWPDVESLDPDDGTVLKGSTAKDLVVVLKSLYAMTNNNPNVLALRTVNVCVGNTVMKMDVIGTEPRAGL